MKALSKSLLLVLCFSLSLITVFPQDNIPQVTGRVTDENMLPLSGVHIQLKYTDRGTQTDVQGEYSIDAYPGDILVFSHVRMQAEQIRVKKDELVINVRMIEAIQEIEEVEMRKKRETVYKSQKELLKEYPTNKNLIKTSKGIIDKDRSSSGFRMVDGIHLSPGGADFFDALQIHIPGMRVVRDSGKSVAIFLRQYGFGGYQDGISMNQAAFEVDGFIMAEPPTFLSTNDIDRIAVLERNAAYMRYGPAGAGGVIVVNTKGQTWMDDMGVDRSEEHKKLLDSAMRVTHFEPYSPVVPPYLEEMQKVRSEKNALSIVSDQQNFNHSNPYYFLDMYELFISRWENREKSIELSSYIIENFSEDIAVIKALAYLQQRYGYYLDALTLYLKILESQTWNAQPLRDVANAYAEIGDYESALMYYTQYLNILDQLPNAAYDPYGEDMLITTELANILGQNKEPGTDKNDLMTIMLQGGLQTRLVFEWNQEEAEFEIQFVTPEGYYDTWLNKSDQSASQKIESIKNYCSKQFFLGEENIGMWQVNIDYKGNQSELPTYLKVSIYRDYGLPNQQLEIKIYKISKDHTRLQLFTFQQS